MELDTVGGIGKERKSSVRGHALLDSPEQAVIHSTGNLTDMDKHFVVFAFAQKRT